MSILANDPLTQLAFSVYENPGVFAGLLGSGLSRSADIPTGWEITLDLVRRVALAQGTESQPDWAKWYREETGEEPNYSTLLEELASSPEERRSILHSYIEPTAEDREEGRKIPTAAHIALAELVRAGYVRVLVTTNFDRLMENALRERGVEPTTIASVDALKGAEPIAHSDCYILKLHGDYKDARILNTDAELTDYPNEYNALLDRIFDEYGLIVCGWSGAWDHALRAAFLRAPNRRYPVFWAARGELSDAATELAQHRAARILQITDADNFLPSLWQRVQTLEQSHRQSPLSIDLLVNSAKRYLSGPQYRIQLDELVTEEAERLVDTLDSEAFTPQGAWDQAEFRKRVVAYESASESSARIAGVLGRWGDDTEFSLVLDLLHAIRAHADQVPNGLDQWLSMRSYPAVLVFTAYGLGLVRSKRWATLHRLLSAEITREHHEPQRVVDEFFPGAWKGGGKNLWQQLEGFDNLKTPLSDHLLDVFMPWSTSFVGISAGFELLLEQFEILSSITHLESTASADLAEALARRDFYNYMQMPVGRSAWHTSVRKQVLQHIQATDVKRALLEAGFGNGSEDFLDKSILNFQRIARSIE